MGNLTVCVTPSSDYNKESKASKVYITFPCERIPSVTGGVPKKIRFYVIMFRDIRYCISAVVENNTILQKIIWLG